jgi:S-adenosylmethionine:tRNA ribosyltransferase-isomerase
MRAFEAGSDLVREPVIELPAELEAHEPPEARGLQRDDVRLLVSTRYGLEHVRFRDLPTFLDSRDLVVLNSSATVPAAIEAWRSDGSCVAIHVSTKLPSNLFIVEPRNVRIGREQLRLAGGGRAKLLTPYKDSRRLWIARLDLPVRFLEYLNRHGAPIQYRHSSRPWPLEFYQNVYASAPGSAEMPSAGRPFTRKLLELLGSTGVALASIVLHAGVSSLERDEGPHEEWFEVPALTAAAVRRARKRGGRIIAVGTTVVRALESALDDGGEVVASRGWTDLVITPGRGVTVADALLTGFHEPRSSHLAMLEAIVGAGRIRTAYRAAVAAKYLWHEFGDSHLILR